MKTSLGTLLLAVLLALPALADEKDAVAKSQKAVEAWTALIDAGKYAESWDAAGSMFKASIKKADWEKAVQPVRSPLGAKKSRKVKSSTFAKELPGAPAGEYVVMQWDTSFENKPDAIETITTSHEKDGSWRVVGYFIK